MSPPAPHLLPVRVYYEDTDAGGIVYHAAYLRFAERGRTELLRAHGLEHRSLAEREGGQFAVRRCTIDFRAPARLDDLLQVETLLVGVRGASLELAQTVRREAVVLVVLAVQVAFVGLDGRPRRLPEALKRLLAPVATRSRLSPRAGSTKSGREGPA